MDDLWTIQQLSAETALALSKLDLAQESGRVSDAPSPRTIRYYTTHGLLDRPLTFRGRTALYGPRHVLQLLAIKRLQSTGRALTHIQDMLAGARDEELREFAGVIAKDGGRFEKAFEKNVEENSGIGSRDMFWKARSTPRPSSEDVSDGRKLSNEKTEASFVLPTVRLAEGAYLVLDTSDLFDADIESIRAAAEPLIALLQQRRILRPKQ